MGMFDSIMLNVKCPYCGEEEVRECQTKDLDCYLDVYTLGDKVKTLDKWLECITDCESEACKLPGSRLGNFFNLKIRVKECKITNKYKII
jgi:wobble nucleotide-excising tRNase